MIISAEAGVDSLAGISQRRHWRAESGVAGQGDDCFGRHGGDLQIRVPPGTLLIDADAGHVIKDLAADEQVVAARGGRGGKGNLRFKSATNRAPRESTPGEEGESRWVILELKAIADVGLIGKPNAGKSTMLSRLSRARPEIAAYPFTTKFPNLGQVRIDADRSFILADIPGLIEGAHAGVGLGHDFLRHIERAGILVHLVEPEPMDGSEPLANYHAVRQELGLYQTQLLERPEIVAVTKAELPSAAAVHAQLSAELPAEVLLVSAVTGQGLNLLVQRIGTLLAETHPERNRPPQAAPSATSAGPISS